MLNTDARERYHLENAIYFTAIRGRGPARIRREFSNLDNAVAWARTEHGADKRTMLYAVSLEGPAHIRNV